MKTLSKFGWIEDELAELKIKNLHRRFRVLEEIKGTQAKVDGKKVSLFCGNDYLGLSQHPKLIEAAKEVLEEGVGTGSARLISGTTLWHTKLEDRIAQFLKKDRALLFSSGYLANLGALSALTQKGDTIILDKLCHASLIDAAHLSQAEVRVYPHKNLGYLEKLLKHCHSEPFGVCHPESFDCHAERSEASQDGLREGSACLEGKLRKESQGQRSFGLRPQDDRKGRGRIWIVTDSVFSMDGDLAPLAELVELKNRYGAYLVIDEAHATGVFGEHGRGVSEYLGVSEEIDVHIGTLSKAIGTFGGFVAGRRELIEYLVNHARTFIFETALPPSICAAAIQAFDLIGNDSNFRNRLWQNVKRIKDGFHAAGIPLLESVSPIIPVLVGDEKRTLEAAQFLLEQGFLIPAIRYPTVPKGKARLRITVSFGQQDAEIDSLILAVKHLVSGVD